MANWTYPQYYDPKYDPNKSIFNYFSKNVKWTGLPKLYGEYYSQTEPFAVTSKVPVIMSGVPRESTTTGLNPIRMPQTLIDYMIKTGTGIFPDQYDPQYDPTGSMYDWMIKNNKLPGSVVYGDYYGFGPGKGQTPPWVQTQQPPPVTKSAWETFPITKGTAEDMFNFSAANPNASGEDRKNFYARIRNFRLTNAGIDPSSRNVFVSDQAVYRFDPNGITSYLIGNEKNPQPITIKDMNAYRKLIASINAGGIINIFNPDSGIVSLSGVPGIGTQEFNLMSVLDTRTSVQPITPVTRQASTFLNAINMYNRMNQAGRNKYVSQLLTQR